MEISRINPIGIGTYNLDLENKDKTLEALLHSVSKGQNLMSTSLLYDNYEVVNFLCEFFKKAHKDEIFLMCHVEPYIEKREDVEKQLDEYLRRMKVDYVDALQIHVSYASKIPLLETYEEIDKLVKKGKVKHISASNTSLEELKELQANFKIFSFEGVYNLECKYYENAGLIDFCKENDIEFICYQALRRNNIASMNYPFLVEMTKKYNKTQNQILLNWIMKEKELSTIIKANSIDKINSNWDSQNFVMEEQDLEMLNNFQDKRFNDIEIDWKNEGGITIDKLASQFKL
ncbi:MAG: aldo/keto reductase [Oscillospiraceae bacterium]|nr:aldo/keto reductase [Oscillospiraceae bacterium]